MSIRSFSLRSRLGNRSANGRPGFTEPTPHSGPLPSEGRGRSFGSLKLFGSPLPHVSLLSGCLALFTQSTALAAFNNWTNTSGGLWRTAANWSAGIAPDSSSLSDPAQVTNAGVKTITIDSLTPAANLSLRGLTLSAPTGSTNTLVLDNVPPATPLTTSKPLLVGIRSSLCVTNSAVNATAGFDITNASVILHGSSLTCGLNCDLQNGSLLVNDSTLTATAGSTGIRMGRVNGAITSFTLAGGTVTSLRLTLGSVTGTQNTLAINGGNLILNDSLSLAQIQNTTGNSTLTAGNLFVTNGTTKIADRAAATFTQSGGSAAFADISIGDLGVGTLNVSDGLLTATPHTTNDLFIVGNQENGTLNQSGGVAWIREEIHVADFPGVTGAINLNGGQFIATNDLVAIGRYGSGSLLLANATAVLTNTSVGRHEGAFGLLTLENGGNLFMIADLSIGRLTNSSGQLIVNGGLLSATNDDLWIGRDGAGDLQVNSGLVRVKDLRVGESPDLTNTPAGTATFNGGITVASVSMVVGTSLLSTGQVTVAGGTVNVTNASGSATLVMAQGNLALNSGVLDADQILCTNAAGAFIFNGGTLRARNMTVNNGAPFVVGNGVDAATLELQGGVFNFPNGLVISPNASLTGCGSIFGPITTNGAVTLNCPPTINITSVTKSGNDLTVLFTSLTGSNHILEYKTNLTAPAWTAIPPAVIGDGNVMSKTDPAATNAMRFYRVRTQ